MNQYSYNNYPGQQGGYGVPGGLGMFQYETLSSYTTKTFGWMFAGLGTTFLVSVLCYMTNLALVIFAVPMMPLLLAIAEFAVVIYMTARMHHISVGRARSMFFLYAALNGVVFSSYFYLFNMTDMIAAFGTTALYFGIMAGYGYLTKKDLCGWSKPLFFGLIAILIASLLSFFIPGMNLMVSCVGIVIFACYTAYDTQKIKAAYFAYAGNEQLAKKASVFAALELYLDFINMFLYILRIFARNQDN